MTPQEELDFVNSTIKAILDGAQSYSIGDRSVTRADLSKLFDRKKELSFILDRQVAGVFTSVGL
jgi:hypothetical protein